MIRRKMFNAEKRRAKKIRKLEDRIADTRHAQETWGFSWSPSRHRETNENIAKWQEELNLLRGTDV